MEVVMGGKKTSHQAGDPAESVRERVLPDPAICRTKLMIADCYDCLVADPRACPKALSFGNSYYCLHLQRHEFATRTLQPAPPSKLSCAVGKGTASAS